MWTFKTCPKKHLIKTLNIWCKLADISLSESYTSGEALTFGQFNVCFTQIQCCYETQSHQRFVLHDHVLARCHGHQVFYTPTLNDRSYHFLFKAKKDPITIKFPGSLNSSRNGNVCKALTFDLLCRISAESRRLDSPITPAWSLASHHSTSLSTSLRFVPNCSAASATTHTQTPSIDLHSKSVLCLNLQIKQISFSDKLLLIILPHCHFLVINLKLDTAPLRMHLILLYCIKISGLIN